MAARRSPVRLRERERKGISGAAKAAVRKSDAETPWERQRQAEQHAHGAVADGPPVGLLDAHARLVDEMHVIDARGAGRHAGEAGEAAVDVQHCLGVRWRGRFRASP